MPRFEHRSISIIRMSENNWLCLIYEFYPYNFHHDVELTETFPVALKTVFKPDDRISVNLMPTQSRYERIAKEETVTPGFKGNARE